MSKFWRLGAISLILSVVLAFSLGLSKSHASKITTQGSEVAIASEKVAAQNLSSAKAVVKSTADPSKILGEAVFAETDNGIEVVVILDNAPSGTHAFHVHEVGSCADNGKAAKGHFNPDNVKHGYLPTNGFRNAHAGDLGNIEISENGVGIMNLTIAGLSLEQGKYAIANRSVILHAKPDDFGQPVGNAGDRVGCGIINLAAM